MKKHIQRLTQLAKRLGISKELAREYEKSGIFVRYSTKSCSSYYYDFNECKRNLKIQKVLNKIQGPLMILPPDSKKLHKKLERETSLRLEEMQKEIQELNSITHRCYIENQSMVNSIIKTVGAFILISTITIIAILLYAILR